MFSVYRTARGSNGRAIQSNRSVLMISAMQIQRFRTVAILAAALAAAPWTVQAQQDTSSIRVTIVMDEADAVLAIASKAAAGQTPTDADWNALLRSEPYVRLKERDASFHRPIVDSAFQAFVLSPELRARLPELRRAVDEWRRMDVRAAAGRAFAYLPRGTVLRAKVYPVIKPRENSFVWDLDGDPAIFFYVDPSRPAASEANTVAHELHHVGYAEGCADGPKVEGGVGLALGYLSTFGEGLAVLAAAGGPDVHPHASSPAAERAVWERDVVNWRRDFGELERFFVEVAQGRGGTDEQVRERWFRFVATDSIPQGAFYTVGWTMASTIERELGRDALVASICSPPRMLAAYNRAARRINGRGREQLPLWSPALFQALGMPELARDD